MSPTIADQVRSRLQVHLDLPRPEERREKRVKAGLSQQELADIIGCTPQAISAWELGVRKRPRGPLLDRYVAALRALQEVG